MKLRKLTPKIGGQGSWRPRVGRRKACAQDCASKGVHERCTAFLGGQKADALESFCSRLYTWRLFLVFVIHSL